MLRRPGSIGSRLAAFVLGTGLLVVVGWPLLATVRVAFVGSEVYAHRGQIDAFAWSEDLARPLSLALQTARVVLATEALAIPAGVLLGFLLFRTDLWGRRLLLALVGIALFVPVPLLATAWLGAFGNVGRTNFLGVAPFLLGWQGAAFVHAMAALPWVVLITGFGLLTVEPALEESALLDRSAGRVLLSVTLRRALGPILAAMLMVAVLTAGDMTVTDLLQVRTYAEEVYIQSQSGTGPAAAVSVVVLPLLLLGGLTALGLVLVGRADQDRLALATAQARRWRLGRARLPLGLAVLGLVGGSLLLPVAAMVWRAGRVVTGRTASWSFAGFLGSIARAWPDVVEPSMIGLDPFQSPLLATATWAALSATMTVALAWLLLWMARDSTPWRVLAAVCLALTFAVPGPVAGLSLKFAYHAPFPAESASLLSRGIFAAKTFLHDTPAVVVLAYMQRTLPYALLLMWPAVRQVPRAFLESARIDGYGPAGVVRKVAIPCTRRSIGMAWGVIFVLALGELSASHLVLPPGYVTLSSRVWMLLHTGVESHLASLGLILLAIYVLLGLGVWSIVKRSFRNV